MSALKNIRENMQRGMQSGSAAVGSNDASYLDMHTRVVTEQLSKYLM